MDDSTRRELLEVVQAGVERALSEKETALFFAMREQMNQIATEHNRAKWDRGFGVNCADYDSVSAFRSQIDWMKAQYEYAHSPEGMKVIESLKEMGKIEDPSVLKDVAKLANSTKQQALRMVVIVLLAVFFSALGWTSHNVNLFEHLSGGGK
jgi:hypothetical protein